MNNENSLSFQEAKIREELASGRLVEFETHGFSMIPLLHDGGDKVVLKLPDGRLNPGDVALCKTSDNRYVLHRVVGIDADGYVLRGDNCCTCEKCLSDSDVIGVACAFVRGSRFIKSSSLRYKFYCRFRKQILCIWKLFWIAADRTAANKNKNRK